MYCFVVVFFLQCKQLQRVVTMALKSLYRVCEIKKLNLIFSSFSVRSQNSIVFKLARHLCSSTSLVYLFICIYVWTYVCHFVLWPSRFCVSYVVDPVPNCTKQNSLVYRSVPVSPWNCLAAGTLPRPERNIATGTLPTFDLARTLSIRSGDEHCQGPLLTFDLSLLTCIGKTRSHS